MQKGEEQGKGKRGEGTRKRKGGGRRRRGKRGGGVVVWYTQHCIVKKAVLMTFISGCCQTK